MRDTGEILRAMNKLQAIQADLATISTRADAQRRHDLIELRRQLSVHIGELGRVAEPLFASLDQPELLQTYRSKFSKMRSAAAIHQANWPAVKLDEADDSYRRSLLAVRDGNRDFVEWMQATLATL